MPEFLTVLSLYYACDAMMAHRPLSLTPLQLAQCTAHYDAVKANFAETPLPAKTTPEGVAARRAAYAALKTWETENGVLVTQLRAEAVDFIRENG